MKLTPLQALLLSLLLPGSSHFVMGRMLRGVLALVTCIGLFVVGYSILGDRLWRFTWFPPFDLLAGLFKVLPLNLWPEWPNLGCSIVASFLRETASGSVGANLERLSYLPVPGEHFAFFCTAASGVLSAIWSADAFSLAELDARAVPTPRVSPGVAALVSWMVPGAGHWLLGQRDKGVLIGAAVLVMFLAGMLFAGGHAIDRVDSPAYFIATMLFGGGALFAGLVTAPWMLPDPLPEYYELGITLPVIAGLMNLIVMIDAYTVAEARCRVAGSDEAARLAT